MGLPKRLFDNHDWEAEPAWIQGEDSVLVPVQRMEPILWAVKNAVCEARNCGITDRDEIRRNALEYAREAIEGEELPSVPFRHESGEWNTEVLSPLRLFRFAFCQLGVNRSDPHQQEAVFSRIEKALAEVLA
jgi:hypothetical protein